MKKILHIITGLANGGAERNIVKLCESLDKSKFEFLVVSLTGPGKYGKYLETIDGVRCFYLNLNSGNKLFKLYNLFKLIRKENPDLIQTWLYHADFLGLIIGKLSGVKNIVWNIRSTKLSFKNNSWHVIVIRKLCAFLSFLPSKIVNCSKTSIFEHIKVGYRKNKFVYIPNGYDIEQLYLDQNKSLINDDKIKIGIVGRNDPQKDYDNFFSALEILAKRNINNIHAIVVGKGTKEAYSHYSNQLGSIQITFLGEQVDMLAVYNSFDFLVLSSFSEGFPNVVAEAMACCKPCVVTDVGDAAIIVDNTGIKVPPQDKLLLADAIVQMSEYGKDKIAEYGKLARQRIIEEYSLSKMLIRYENLYLNLIG